MFLPDYHTALTMALALLLLLAVIRLYQIHNEKTSKQSKKDSENTVGLVSSLLEHEEIAPLLDDLASKVKAEYGFDWPQFTLESDEIGADGEGVVRCVENTGVSGATSSRLIRIDKELSVRFRWDGDSVGARSETRLDSVESLTRSCVLNLRRIQRYKRLANRDPLTGLFNVSYLQARLKEEIERAKRFRRSVGVLILDIDHFKEINDKRGHLRGDHALRFLSGLILEHVRAVDIVCRYGGDELCIILPDADESTMRGTMNRLRELIHDRSAEATGIALTVSIGGALSVFGALSSVGLFEEADRAMLLAKRKGRNQCFFTAPSESHVEQQEPD